MTLGASSHATLADVKGGVLWSECMTAECLWFDEWMRFRPLRRGRCLENLIMRYVGHSVKPHKSQGSGADQMLKNNSQNTCRSNAMS